MTSLLCLMCLLLVTLCLFPLLFCLKLNDATSISWDGVFIPLWVYCAFAGIGMLAVTAPWYLRVLLEARFLCVVAFFIVLREYLSDGGLLLQVPLPPLWTLFAALLVEEAFGIVITVLVDGVLPSAYRSECEQGLRRSALGLGYVGWLLRRFPLIATRIAVWCVLAGQRSARVCAVRDVACVRLVSQVVRVNTARRAGAVAHG
jgi:hypothetical protein